MTSIIDTPQITTPQIPHLQADGITTVIRYLSSINPHGEKCIQPAEANALAAAGIRLGLVHEGYGDFQQHGGSFSAISAQAGARDGKFCLAYAPTVGAPAGACIYFAVDTDASASQIHLYVLPYFAAISIVFKDSGFRVGVYGSGAVCSSVIAAGGADLAWLSQSLGWTGSRAYLASKPPQLVLLQGATTKLANLDVDTDQALGEWGDFLPFAPIAQPSLAQSIENEIKSVWEPK